MIADGEENSARRSETAKFGAILLGKSAAGEENRCKSAAGEANYWYVKHLKTSSAGPKTYLAAPQNNLPKVVNTTFPSDHTTSQKNSKVVFTTCLPVNGKHCM